MQLFFLYNCAKYEVNFVFFCYYYAPAITTAHFSDPPYVYLARPAAASTPAGYMFYFCFLFFNDFGLTSYLKIYQTDLCLMFRVGRAMPSVLWRCWLGGRKGIRPVKTEWWGAGMAIYLKRGADSHMAQLMPLPLTISCFSKIQIGFTTLVPAHLGSPGQRSVKRVCVCIMPPPQGGIKRYRDPSFYLSVPRCSCPRHVVLRL